MQLWHLLALKLPSALSALCRATDHALLRPSFLCRSPCTTWPSSRSSPTPTKERCGTASSRADSWVHALNSMALVPPPCVCLPTPGHEGPPLTAHPAPSPAPASAQVGIKFRLVECPAPGTIVADIDTYRAEGGWATVWLGAADLGRHSALLLWSPLGTAPTPTYGAESLASFPPWLLQPAATSASPWRTWPAREPWDPSSCASPPWQ